MTHDIMCKTEQLLGLGVAGGSDEADEVVCSVCWMPQMSGKWGTTNPPSHKWNHWNLWAFSLFPKEQGRSLSFFRVPSGIFFWAPLLGHWT